MNGRKYLQYSFNTELISILYQEFKNFSKEQSVQLRNKLNEQFTKEEIQIANRDVRVELISLAIREMQFNW